VAIRLNRRSAISGGVALLATRPDGARAAPRPNADAQGDSRGSALGPKFFVMGNWGQVPASMATWAARGINTAVTDTDDWAGGDGPGWRAACKSAGLHMILKGTHAYDAGATNTYAADERDPLILAHMTYDEPDLYIALNQSPAQIDAYVADARSKGSAKPFFVNFRNHVPGLEYNVASDGATPMIDFVNMSNVDWQSSDNYGFQDGLAYYFGDLQAQYGFHGVFTTMSGKATKTLYAGPFNGKPLTRRGRAAFQFLSTSRISDVSPGVPRHRQTETQYRLQFWSCVINGACGVVHFSHYFPAGGAPVLDDTDATMESAIRDAVAKLAILQNQGGVNILMDTVNGGRRAFTLRPCAEVSGGGGFDYPANQPNFSSPTGAQMPAWFEGCEIAAGGETYRLVLNMHDTLSKTLTYAAWGMTGLAFAPGQVGCFKASAPGIDIFL
jgi:hypothetical protein